MLLFPTLDANFYSAVGRGHLKIPVQPVVVGAAVGTTPPTVVVFVNKPGLVREDYRRFLHNRLRELLPFTEVPLRLIFRSHRREGATAKAPARQRGRSI